jgi:hypothetical protein
LAKLRVIHGVQDVYLDQQGNVHLVLKPPRRAKPTPWIKLHRGQVLAIKDHRNHDLGVPFNPNGAKSRMERDQ